MQTNQTLNIVVAIRVGQLLLVEKELTAGRRDPGADFGVLRPGVTFLSSMPRATHDSRSRRDDEQVGRSRPPGRDLMGEWHVMKLGRSTTFRMTHALELS